MLTKYTDICAICGRPKECTHHLIFGRGMRDHADADDLTMPMCNDCHNIGKDRIHGNSMAERLSKIIGQLLWEYEYVSIPKTRQQAREEFAKRYGRSYL